MVHIRFLEPHDSIEALTALIHRAYAPYVALGINNTGVDQSAEVTAQRALAGVCFLACDGDNVIGTMSMRGPFQRSQCTHLTQPHVAFQSQLAVEPGWQGKGIAGALFRAGADCARKDGFEELACDVAAPLRWLVEWHERQGFRRIDELTWPGKSYRSVVMTRKLV